MIRALGQPFTRAVQFHYAEIVSPLSFTWAFTTGWTTVQQLNVTKIPAGGTVEVLCNGGGCPFGSRTFSPSGRTLRLEPSLKGSRLRPGTTLELLITDTNRVGKVATFTIHAGSLHTLAEQCLPPGATGPSHCA